MDKKKKKIKVSQIIIVLIVLALIAGAVFITKYLTETQAKNYDSISKWGIQVTKDTAGEEKYNYNTAISQSNDFLKLNWTGEYTAPNPGENSSLDVPSIDGKTEKDLIITFEGFASIAKDDFIIDGQFNCPITFFIGNNNDGSPHTVKGTNFIGRKAEFLSAINDAFENIDVEDVKAGTDMKEHFINFSKQDRIGWELPKDITDAQKEVCKNSKLKLNVSVSMYEGESAKQFVGKNTK